MNRLQLEFYQKIKSYVLSKVRDRQDAEDIVQDVFVKAQLQLHTLRDSDKAMGWMYRITHNVIIDYYRLKKKEQSGFLIDSPEDRHIFNECVEQCLTALSETLPAPYREALILSDKENVPQLELAERWGISYSGAKSRVQRARQMLKEKMENLYDIKTDGYGNVIVCEDKGPCGCSAHEEIRSINMSM